MREGIHEDALRVMVDSGAVRDTRVSRHGEKWSVAIRLGGPTSHWLPVRSRRESVRTWASLSAVGNFRRSNGYSIFRR